jgi:methylglyoxal synthase
LFAEVNGDQEGRLEAMAFLTAPMAAAQDDLDIRAGPRVGGA